MKNICLFITTFVFFGLVSCTSGIKGSASPGISFTGENHLNLPSGLSIDEYKLSAAPGVEPLTFQPLYGSQSDIIAKHESEHNPLTMNLFYDNGQSGIKVTSGKDVLTARLIETVATQTAQGVFTRLEIQVSQNDKPIYSVQAGDSSPLNTLQGLWTYNQHWAMEFIRVTNHSSQNEISTEGIGQVVLDGELVNDQEGYQEAFGLQTMQGKPFYFYKANGQIGIVYANQRVSLGYSQIPHYGCCSAAALNPKKYQDEVTFFAVRNGTWYYVAIGVY